ncbi:MAG: CoA transferase, partial [Rhodospirillales bacterium]
DEHFKERGVLVELPDQQLETAPMHNIIPRLSDTPGTFRLPAPDLGEHTDVLLSQLGLGEERITELRGRGVI